MFRRTIAVAITAVSIMAATTSARAQGPASDEAQAEELAARAYEQYKAKDYEKAIATYQQAYRLAPLAPILFNLANLYDKKLHDADHAIDLYRRYLRAADADPDLAKKAKDRIALLQLQSETKPTPPAPQAPAAKETAKDATPAPATETVSAARGPSPAPGLLSSPYRPYALVAGGVGVIAVGLGVAFGASAMSQNGEAAKMCTGGECFDPRAPETNASARSAATVSTTTFVIGGLALAGAAVLWFLPAPKERGAGVRASVGPTSLSLTGTF